MARVRFLDQVPVGFYDVDNGGGSNPGGPFSSIQYNDGGTLNGDSNLLWDRNTNTVLLNGKIIATSFTGSLFGTSSWAISSSQAQTASYVVTAQTASYVLSASYALSASQARTASYVLNAVSASYALSSSQARTASYVNPLNQNVRIVGSLINGNSNFISDGGLNSHTEGDNTFASSSYSHTEGSFTTTYGIGAHAEGVSTIASGSYSHTEGSNTTTYGYASHAEGVSTVTNGDYSHAEGIGTITNGNYQHVQGAWNASSTTDSAFILGNGTDNNNRSNLIFAAGNQVQITGSLNTSGSVFFSTLVTSSTAVSNVVMYGTNGQLFITASSAIGGGGISGDYVTTASFNAYTGSSTSQFAGTASFAQTASYVPTLKASSASVASFILSLSGYSTSVTFTTAYSNNLYAVSVIGEDLRAWSISGKTNSGFTINSNYTPSPPTGPVYWIATPFNL
jgi:hypothetical protein